MFYNNIRNIDLSGKKVLIRVDYNVPIQDGLVIDNYRIKASLPTINYCLKKDASIILMSHLGRPNGKILNSLSLDPVAFELESLVSKDVMFSTDCISDESIELTQQMNPGEIHLLENLRFHKGEVENDPSFAWYLSRHAEIYINDAFGTAHRSHASNVGILEYVKFASIGMLMENEKKYLYESMKSPKSPNILILGGSKIKDKINIIKNLIKKLDKILIGGAMCFTFLKAQGKNIGSSLYEPDSLDLAKSIIMQAKTNNVSIHLPDDIVVSKKLDYNSPCTVRLINDIKNDESGYDIGPETTLKFQKIINSSNTILWNGPLGVFEVPLFSTGTQSIASYIKDRTMEGAISIIGGGDTAASIKNTGYMQYYSHVSTGGGASLDLLSGKKLPAFKFLENNDK